MEQSTERCFMKTCATVLKTQTGAKVHLPTGQQP
uniref:Uncharacterized protein n=1 Tax=Anguilla anguilla TaxID=7936 RepID=A0A0E9QAZ8_ANGAN